MTPPKRISEISLKTESYHQSKELNKPVGDKD